MTRPSEDLSRGPGLTPIDSTSLPSPTDRRTEPDRTTGRIPAQEDDSAKHRKPENDKKNGDRDR